VCTGGIYGQQETFEDLPFGWQRVTGSFNVKPQPDWEKLTWSLSVNALAGKIAIDNLYVGAHCEVIPEPSSLAALGCPLLGLLVGLRRRG